MKTFAHVALLAFLGSLLCASTLNAQFDNPASLTVKNASSAITLDGKLDEASWTGAPTLIYGNGAQTFKVAGENTVTAGVDVKNPFTDATVVYNVPNTDSSWGRVKFLRKGMNLYIGITSNDKSIGKFDWEGDGIFLKVKNSVGQGREFKLYWQNIDANKDTMRYEEQIASTGSGWGSLPAGSTVNDTNNVDNGYSGELRIDLAALGYTAPLGSVEVSLTVFDPDGYQHPMNTWDHNVGSFYKSWWGSEWGDVYRSLMFTLEPFEDPDTLAVKIAAGTMSFDGKLDEADWTGAPTLAFGAGAQLKKVTGEYTVTAGLDIKNPFTDADVVYRVPHTDSTLTRVKFLQKIDKLYIGIQSDDKSLCKFDWEGDGLFMKLKTAVGQAREFKLYWQNTGVNKDTIRYEEQIVGLGMGKGYLLTGSTVNDTDDVDNGYEAELMVDLVAMGYTGSDVNLTVQLAIFDPDGYEHPMNAWDHTIGSYYKSWWGSEWGDVFRTLKLQSPVTGAETADHSVPSVYSLGQNYPNPFNPSTTIQFGLPTRSMVTLKIYDVLGREVQTLVNGEMAAGTHDFVFHAGNLSSGLYFYILSATPLSGDRQEPFASTKKLLLVK
ncbi:MAG: hypothetical protein A2X67_02880 [Ignavibacteria bacterium GWA2_55_11]|nr:MAG: hypothetical protein A2X67_02880 [Ignavibacteria bacterium GWA2_55_11]OGU65057.1 MAG: hypothetical protein A3C56_04510 [Ignavibacteria bacterium RIFCSPHIGHO2_02_FULL_56_12]OGU72778.1 MAG: hypothetical protein A3H45_04600 [Ignavibacteria bacterium RIFCSPLOWO2_02_FULL_55_14]